ncbi:hypothetical protein QFZ27_000650 [Inquilinus ginsengisoli]
MPGSRGDGIKKGRPEGRPLARNAFAYSTKSLAVTLEP